MKKLLALVVLFALAGLGCSETPISFPLRSLERSGEVSFVCVGEDGEGFDINSCPDFESAENRRHMLALVTQTLRGEVAIVDLSAGKVVDLDPSTPGYGFIPVGANPQDIVSTPGGVASFVGVAEVGKEGIFAIPSSCAKPPPHDLVSWPACSLLYPPGEMAIVLDPLASDGSARPTCDSAFTMDAVTPGTALAATREECPADLALETTPPGRRKLLVTFPSAGMYGVIDAQEILDREPGTFAPCNVRYFETKLDLPTTPIVQKVPEDLQAPGCTPPEINYGPPTLTYSSQPAGIDVSEDRLFIADRGAPLVHVIDIHDPCEPVEQPPLLALSFDAPNRDNIFTQHVAVSPPTTTGQRFAYAVDDRGDVMIFDATPGASDRTPIVRPGSPRLPFEAPDRIQFDSPARDVTFALRDVPIFDPETGVATVGTFCEPDPGLSNTVGAKYRSNSDFSGGARPHNLRGVFGFIMLASGQVAVIDVEDFDARCRRPVAANSGTEEDFRGCFADPSNLQQSGYATQDGKRTVSNELSCRVVEQHRSRSGRVLVNTSEFGVNAPALRNFPRLSLDGGNLTTDRSEEGQKQPRVLAVPPPNPVDPKSPLPVEVHVGVNLFSSADTAENPVDINPESAERLSVGLVLQEPRAFFGDDDVRLTYEGKVVGDRPAGRLEIQSTGPSSLTDNDGGFCDRGVESVALMRERGTRLGVPTANLDAFARQHADYVQIISGLRDRNSSYWTDSIPASCPVQGKSAFFACRDLFGEGGETLQTLRDFVILDSFQGSLVIEPRAYLDEAQKQEILELYFCCFGASYEAYNIRAGNHWVLTSSQGVQHNVLADEGFHCIRDCNPRRQYQDARVFEISSNGSTGNIGAATSADVACVIDDEKPVLPGSPEEACIFQNLTHRFAVYRGSESSKRDMAFDWNVTGGFIPLTASLASQSRAVSPQSIVFVPQIGQLAVADGAAEGLVLISLDSVNISRLFF